MRSTRFVFACAAACAAAIAGTFTTGASADTAACKNAAEQGQRDRAAGLLRSARGRFMTCAAETCPGVVRTDCAHWAADLDAVMPSIVVDARDDKGGDVDDVAVAMDGEVLTRKLDGKPIAVDTGMHTFTFSRTGWATVSERLLIKEAAKDRPVRVAFDHATPAAPPAGTSSTPAASAGDPAVSSTAGASTAVASSSPKRGHTTTPWVVAGVGAAAVVSGAVLLVVGIASIPSNCTFGSATCTRTPAEKLSSSGVDSESPAKNAAFAQDEANAGSAASLAGVGFLVGALGAVALGVGLIWHFRENTDDPPGTAALGPSMTVRPTLDARGGGLTVLGAF